MATAEKILTPARVRVPCSTSNLGSGFDCVGLALDLYLDASFEPDAAGACGGDRVAGQSGIVSDAGEGGAGGAGVLRLERTGTLVSLREPPEEDLLARVFSDALGREGLNASGTLRVHSAIPIGRGLGSSAAAVVAGLALAGATRRHNTYGLDANRQTSFCVSLLPDAERIEGHPDNVAPALLGGLIVSAHAADGRTSAMRHPVSDRIGFAFAAPGAGVSTAEARAALPASIGHAVAGRSVGRLAALLRGLAEADPDLLEVGFTDELHVPYREPLIPGAAAAMDAAREAGAWAVTISGAGSGLIAAAPKDDANRIAEAMAAAFERVAGKGTVHMVLQPEMMGTRIGEAVR